MGGDEARAGAQLDVLGGDADGQHGLAQTWWSDQCQRTCLLDEGGIEIAQDHLALQLRSGAEVELLEGRGERKAGLTRQRETTEMLISAYYGDNYYPLMWRFYRSHRSTLLRLAHTLRLVSTVRDTSAIDPLELVLADEGRTGDYQSATVNLATPSP
jgi:hypothetical protein